MKPVRLLPVLMVSAIALLGVKGTGLVLTGGYALDSVATAAAQTSPADDPAKEDEQASEEADSPADKPSPAAKKTGFPAKRAPRPGTADAPGEEPSGGARITKSGDTVIKDFSNAMTFGSRSRDALLERLGDRRQRLEKREKELELREQLLAATEKRIEARIAELKRVETEIKGEVDAQEKQEQDQLSGLVKMYETMKPKDAARIFDRLDLDVLVQVVKQINPRKMAAILGRMEAEPAERLTIALATGDRPRTNPPVSRALPKIGSNPAKQ